MELWMDATVFSWSGQTIINLSVSLGCTSLFLSSSESSKFETSADFSLNHSNCFFLVWYLKASEILH